MRVLSGYLVAVCLAMFGTLASVTWLTGVGLETTSTDYQPALAALSEFPNLSK